MNLKLTPLKAAPVLLALLFALGCSKQSPDASSAQSASGSSSSAATAASAKGEASDDKQFITCKISGVTKQFRDAKAVYTPKDGLQIFSFGIKAGEWRVY